MAVITMTKGLAVTVDDADFDWLSSFSWWPLRSTTRRSAKWYAYTTLGSGEARRNILMHRMISAAPSGLVVDHINGDTLDNRRGNLRVCPQALNNANNSRRGKAGFRGVYLRQDRDRPKPFRAEISFQGERHRLGDFATAEEAARAYDAAALRMFGDFARPNFSNEG